MLKTNSLKIIIFIVIFLLIISIILGLFIGFLKSLRLIFGFFYAIIIPGFIWSYVLFKNRKGNLSLFERIILSIILSTVLVPFEVFIFNKLGFKINASNVCWEILMLVVLGLIVYYLKNKRVKKYEFKK